MSTMQSCAGCNKTIISSNREIMKCSICCSLYDLECANISPKRFHSMIKDSKLNWKCPQCRCTEPKTGNTNTPIRAATQCMQDISFVTTRNTQKPRRKSSDDTPNAESQLSTDNLRILIREELSAVLKTTLNDTVTAQLKSINEKMISFEETLNFFNCAYENMKSCLEAKSKTIETLERDNAILKNTMREMGNRLGMVEQYLRESNLEINGVPEENTENLQCLVTQIANTVHCEISSNDIVHVTRVAKQSKEANRPRSIIVKLKSRTLRDSMLAATVKFNKTQDPKLNSHHLGYGGKPAPVYLSEHLSPANKSLHAAARKRARETGYRFVWIKDGRIYARKDEKSPAIYLRDHDSLSSMS